MKMRYCMWFLIPTTLWLGLFLHFAWDKFAFCSDAKVYYDFIQYYLQNISSGIYPLWDPFQAWGRPDSLSQRYFGEFNPFLYLILLFHTVGFSLYHAFLIYIFSYLWIGFFGFYLLAQRIFGERRLAWLAYCSLLYTTLGVTIFNDIAVILLIVPMIWFFYFLLSLLDTWGKKYFLGVVFSLMVIMTTYLPFYFMTVFFALALGCLLLFAPQIPTKSREAFAFIKDNKGLVGIGLVLLFLSIIPGIFWYISSASGDYVVTWRNEGAPVHHPAGVHISVINAGSIAGPFTLTGLLSNLSEMQIGFIYIPLFLLILSLLSMKNPLTRKSVIFLCVGVFLILVSLADVTPIHRFLYDHIFFFKLFRNLIYIFWASIPFLILFVVEQFRIISNTSYKKIPSKTVVIAFILLVHAAFLAWLFSLGQILPSTVVTFGLSALFFILYVSGRLKKEGALLYIFLSLLMAIEPAQVFLSIQKNAKEEKPLNAETHLSSTFIYIRPEQLGGFEIAAKGKETSGFIGMTGEIQKYIGTKRSYMLQKEIPPALLWSYAQHKFIVYDNTVFVKDEEAVEEFQRLLRTRQNTALVAQNTLTTFTTQGEKSPYYQPITGESDALRVVNFNANQIQIKTNFSQPKFLVYNDSFFPGWKVFVNGKEEDLYRANVAFKGIWLPAGENRVIFSFGSTALIFFIKGLLVIFVIVLIRLCFLLFKGASKYSGIDKEPQHEKPIGTLTAFWGQQWVLYILVLSLVLWAVDAMKVKMKILNFLRVPFEELLVAAEDKSYKLSEEQLQAHIRYYQKIVEYFPEISEAYGLLGFCYYQAGDVQKSIAAYQKASELNTHFFWFPYNLGIIYFNEGQLKEAAASFQKALSISAKETFLVLQSSMLLKSKESQPKEWGAHLEQGYKNAFILLKQSELLQQNESQKVRRFESIVIQ